MQTSNLWYMHLVQRFKITAAIFLVLSSTLLSTTVIAQPNQEQYDNKLLHFGFTLALNFSTMRMDTKPEIMMRDSVMNARMSTYPGIGLGGITNVRLGKNFDVRLLFPVIYFVQRDIIYELPAGKREVKVESAYSDFSLLLKFKSDRRKNTRAYIIGGGRISYDLSSTVNKERSKNSPVVSLVPVTYGYEAGFGLDLYFPYFKFSPEIKVMNTIGDALHRDGFAYTNVLDRVSPKMVVISLHFE
ncbi:MAG: outer membrane beta-barrel protein [Bacteroidota bacterium]|jgi:hypothetical protein